MPAVSQAQRGYLNRKFGHAWVKRHGFDNKGHLPQHASGRGGLKPLASGLKPVPIDEKCWSAIRTILRGKDPTKAQLPFLCGALPSGVAVFVVDGNKIKVEHDMDFVEGGNLEEDPGLAKFVPEKYRAGKKAILLDWFVRPVEWPFICYHEETERLAMSHGASYNKAHPPANAGERVLRMR